ncbi:MAG: hypothetical protein KKB77_10255, partial [Bacteroidetes bacterium]|nr:hypothetical protein [Bacteroidota bacterium]
MKSHIKYKIIIDIFQGKSCGRPTFCKTFTVHTTIATELYGVIRFESGGLLPNSLEQNAPLSVKRGILLNRRYAGYETPNNNLSNHKINKLFILLFNFA